MLLAVAGWCLAVGAATMIGLAALRVVGEGLTGGPAGEVLDQQEIARQLAAASPTPSASASATVPPAPAPTGLPASPATSPDPPSPSPSDTAVQQVAATPGGTVVAACDGALARLVSWAPAQGYTASDVDRGPYDDAEVSFVGAAGEYEVTVVCAAGRPQVTWELDD